MFGILAALYALQAQGIGLDGEAAVGQAQRLLHTLGIRENLSLLALNHRFYLAQAPCWYVGLESKRGLIVVVLDARTGRALFIQARPDPGIDRRAGDPPTFESTRRLKEMLHRLGYDKDVILKPRAGYANGPAGGIFYRTLHDLPFFNVNPTYGHRLVVDPATGAVNYFLPSPPLPGVNAWEPIVSGPDALAKMQLWAEQRAEQQRKGLNTEWKRWPELGYWKFANEERARLVWQSMAYTVQSGATVGMGAYRVLVDALTGELLEPDDSAIGANP